MVLEVFGDLSSGAPLGLLVLTYGTLPRGHGSYAKAVLGCWWKVGRELSKEEAMAMVF